MWEIKQRVLVDMAADRGAFIDQSQSFNVHMSDVNFGKLTSLHFYAWKVRPHCKPQQAALRVCAESCPLDTADPLAAPCALGCEPRA